MYDGGLLAVDYAPYVAGILALIGSLVGVYVAFQLDRRGREEERRNWLNDQRQAVYPKFIAAGQSLLNACEEVNGSDPSRSLELDEVQKQYRDLVVHNAVIQTLGQRGTIDAARLYMYTLAELRDLRLGRKPDPGGGVVGELMRGARESRHRVLLAMRHELDVPDSAGLEDDLKVPKKPLRVPASGRNS